MTKFSMTGYLDDLGKRGGWTGYGPREAALVADAIEGLPPDYRLPAYVAYEYIVTRRRERDGRVISCVSDREIYGHIPKAKGRGHLSGANAWERGLKRKMVDAGMLQVTSERRKTATYVFPLLESVLEPGNSERIDSNVPSKAQPNAESVLFQKELQNKTGKEEESMGISVAGESRAVAPSVVTWVRDIQEDRCPYCGETLLTDGERFKCPSCDCDYVWASRSAVMKVR